MTHSLSHSYAIRSGLEEDNAIPVMKVRPVRLSNPDSPMRPTREKHPVDWLREELGLSFNPFEHLDAQEDVRLPSYLIGHEDFARLWGPWPNLLFAPPGGGKTAFRVRLSWACRTQEERKRFFPTLFYLPNPHVAGLPPNEDVFFAELLRATGHELLFYLAYHACEFPDWNLEKRRRVRQALAETGIPLEHYLEQIEDAGSLAPLLESAQRAGSPGALSASPECTEDTIPSLPQEPLPDSLNAFCHALRKTPVSPVPQRSPLEQMDILWPFILQDLGQEAIFILVDGADAYNLQPTEAVLLLEPLLRRVRAWAERKVMLKFFLPEEFRRLLEPSPLTEPARIVIMEWSRNRLVDVLRERLRVASRGSFDSFKAIGSPHLTRDVEARLAEAADPPVPREVIFLAQQLLASEVWQKKADHGRLEPEDLQSILDDYKEKKGRGRSRSP